MGANQSFWIVYLNEEWREERNQIIRIVTKNKRERRKPLRASIDNASLRLVFVFTQSRFFLGSRQQCSTLMPLSDGIQHSKATMVLFGRTIGIEAECSNAF
mmetsp:Transcript_3368/g.7690  ORF Transcript_3368/g.7690 Transcript_3368/m.7690 type:complete len:101 (-) Transcript_3368:716-1018(-)